MWLESHLNYVNLGVWKVIWVGVASLAVVILVQPEQLGKFLFGLMSRECLVDTQYMSVTKISLKMSAAPSVVKKHLKRTKPLHGLLLARTPLESLRK